MNNLLAPFALGDCPPKGGARYVATAASDVFRISLGKGPPSQAATYSEQAHNCLNFVFRRNFPIHKIFERSAELGGVCLTADKIAQIFGVRKHKRLRGKLHGMLERVDHGHHVLRVYCKSLVARM